MKDGKLNVDVIPNYATMKLNEDNIELLKKFHFLLFNEIIPAIKSFMLFDNNNLENSFLIVPCKYDCTFCCNMHYNIAICTCIIMLLQINEFH